MIQFINGLAVRHNEGTAYLDDAVSALMIPIDRIAAMTPISHEAIQRRLRFTEDEPEDRSLVWWTELFWTTGPGLATAYFRHDIDDIAKAVATLNQDKTRTTCLIDDRSSRSLDAMHKKDPA